MSATGTPLFSDSRSAPTSAVTSTPLRPTRNMLSSVPKCLRVWSMPMAMPIVGAISRLGVMMRIRHRCPRSKSGNRYASVMTRFAEKISSWPSSSRKMRPRWLGEVVPLVMIASTASDTGNEATISCLKASVG